jgi:hypothetical protein
VCKRQRRRSLVTCRRLFSSGGAVEAAGDDLASALRVRGDYAGRNGWVNWISMPRSFWHSLSMHALLRERRLLVAHVFAAALMVALALAAGAFVVVVPRCRAG